MICMSPKNFYCWGYGFKLVYVMLRTRYYHALDTLTSMLKCVYFGMEVIPMCMS
jgi:hypothetical protein